MATYRVFLTRHYIDATYYEVDAPDARRARRLAEKAAKKERKDSRAVATDNGWIADEPYITSGIGKTGEDTSFDVELFIEDHRGKVYKPKGRGKNRV